MFHILNRGGRARLYRLAHRAELAGGGFYDNEQRGSKLVGQRAASVRGARHRAGVTLIDGEETSDHLQCVHCGCHWIHVQGSRRRRGFCTNCMGPHCGGPRCWTCLPYEKRLELQEKGKWLEATGLIG
jgi:hypothetical protein